MNALFGISNDADILAKPLANRDEIEAFENDVGHFFCRDTFKPIIMRFRWDARNKDRPGMEPGVFSR